MTSPALLLVLVVAACGATPPPHRPPPPPTPWPAEGLCLDAIEPCVRLTPADAEAMRQAALAYLIPTPPSDTDLSRAARLFDGPITFQQIGSYHVFLHRPIPPHDVVVKLRASEVTETTYINHDIILGRSETGWVVVSAERLEEGREHID